MSHLDEGMIHELLDGELPPDEARAARSHLVTCAECRALYEEAKEFFAESERLVAALDASDGLVSRPPAIPRPTGSPLGPSRPSRGLPLRTMAWAASIFLAISLGYYGSDFRNRAKSKEEAPANVVVAPPQQPENAPAVAEPPAAPPPAATSPTGQERRKQAAPAEKLQRTDQLAA
jgi:anti-sigma factor RsiW